MELPFFVNDMYMDIIDWEGVCNMQRVETSIKMIVREVTEEYKLTLEERMEEIMHLQKRRKE